MKSVHIICLILGALCLVEARTVSRQAQDSLPKLDDTLAVAKSPLEPVTMALTFQSAPKEESAETTKSDFGDNHKQTTRAVDQDGDSTSGDAGNSEQVGSTKSIAPATTPETPSTTENMEAETGTTTASGDSEMETTTVAAATTTLRTEEKTAEVTPTTTTMAPTETTTELRVETSEASTEAAPTTTAAPVPTTTVESTTTETPKEETTTADIVRVVDSSTVSPTTEAEAQTTTTTTAIPSAEPDHSKEKEVSSVSEGSNGAPAPVSTAAPPSSVAPTEKPAAAEEKKEEKNESKPASCSHLPTYDSDEIQKVFREETTYKNGTIKGKFTYINFDQRYRLVHYTRLPYGPVKIDLVEELGKPEPSGNHSASPLPPSEIPNAVLQLRNILPNSLFGFPFLNSNPANAPKPVAEPSRDSEDNRYFYSTDSIATPNLLTPRVPVSLPPGHRKYPSADAAHTQPAADTLSQIYNNENLAVNSHLLGAGPKLYRSYADSSANVGSPRAMSSHSYHYHGVNPSGLVYTHVPPPQYHYAPITVYPLQPPSYISSARSTYEPVQFDRRQDNAGSAHGNLLSSHQAHQPHSHEHFMAPFMYAQTPQNDQPADVSRLKLRVKSSKSLNVGGGSKTSGTKSAQLRLEAPSGARQLVSPASHGALRHQRQQRLGKQNHELKTSVNTSPVVYHVLRSPVGKMYSLPEYNGQHQPGHSMAYDHDN